MRSHFLVTQEADKRSSPNDCGGDDCGIVTDDSGDDCSVVTDDGGDGCGVVTDGGDGCSVVTDAGVGLFMYCIVYICCYSVGINVIDN